MEGNALELVLQNKQPTEQQAKALMAEGAQHRVVGRQLFAIGAQLLKQVCKKEEVFLAYMQNEYGYERAAAYRYAQAGEVLINLSTTIDREWLPQSISQAVELAVLPKDQQAEAWEALLNKKELKKITGDIVASHVATLKGISAPPVDVQETESPVIQKTEPVEAELVEDDEPEDEEPEDEEPLSAPAPPARRTFAPHPHFPPFGCERTNRLKLLALGIKLVRRVETDAGSIIYQWQESERSEGGWQQLHAGNVRQVDVYWDSLLQSPTAFDA